MSEKTILVLGIGNLLLGDEGVSVHTVHQLQEMSLPREADVIDSGTIGFELLPFLEGKVKVIIVDAPHADAEMGEILRFGTREANLRWAVPYSPYQGRLRELLDAAATLVHPPEIVVLGIVPEEINAMTIGLSHKVHRRMPAFLSAIQEEIQSSALNIHA